MCRADQLTEGGDGGRHRRGDPGVLAGRPDDGDGERDARRRSASAPSTAEPHAVAVEQSAARLGVGVDPDARVEQLSVGERQRVEILKALHHECRVLILDEPTAVLTPLDVDALFGTIRRLRSEGIGVVFISHKLREVAAIADRVTVLRRGRIVTTQPIGTLDPDQPRRVDDRPRRRPR